MSIPSRPRMGVRAISEMHPLITPSQQSSVGDLGRGTQATSGGAHVASGARTALGAIAPQSPFLPLPDAPSAEELTRQYSQNQHSTSNINGLLSVESIHSHPRRIASNSAIEGEEPKSKKSRAVSSNAAHMIRSYSMPVATQVDFEAQRMASLQRLPYQPSFSRNTDWENGWPKSSSPSKAFNVNAMTSTVSSMGYNPKTLQQQQLQQQQQQHRQLATQKTAKVSPRLQSRSPLSIITINETVPKNDQSMEESNSTDIDLGSGSDEADVATPRAISPRESYFGCNSGKEPIIPMFENFEDFVHPDHLRPPPSLSL